MSKMSAELAAQRPDWPAIPEPLEQAWLWMEEHGHGIDNDNGYFLTPYAGERQLGAVFSPTATLDGWFEPGTPGHARLLPIGEAAGDGSLLALWLDDANHIRTVTLGSVRSGVLADHAVDFLRLLAIGYDELNFFTLGSAPEDEEAVEAVADFRAWVVSTFEVEVPAEWPGLGDDDFSTWLDAQFG